MNEAIEALLVHWGDQLNKCGSAGGLGSAMGTIVEFKGCAPRGGVGGSKLLLAGAGPDYVACEVEAALAAIERVDGGVLLHALARRRYAYRPQLSVAEQVADLAIGRGDAGRRAYTRLVGRLHELLELELHKRLGGLAKARGQARREGDRFRAASVRQAVRAHRGRGAEFEAQQGGQGAIAAHKARRAGGAAPQDDRSSGDSAPPSFAELSPE
ncbi:MULTISPECIES: hypothetical protein [unclassified Pseudomonas]|uniref:hypothetical protein n=1 Tax=unclassified Pseudomonas TaxID=196821 RepID=UPI00244B0C67|nr:MULTISPECIES: hypothetical protein [unclassified Pseudomonas]MDG9926131.1 hypothetical protein [Pseudomonas sp. GD04045]MDH0037475.1 hypothetical protein [Pseudomonas sp. GD04019]